MAKEVGDRSDTELIERFNRHGFVVIENAFRAVGCLAFVINVMES